MANKVEPIRFEYNGIEYVLEFTRATVRRMESEGFDRSKIDTKTASVVTDLFYGAFYAHHKFTKPELKEEIFENIRKSRKGNEGKEKDGTESLATRLMELYNLPIAALLEDDEDSEDNENLIEWH